MTNLNPYRKTDLPAADDLGHLVTQHPRQQHLTLLPKGEAGALIKGSDNCSHEWSIKP